MLPELANRLVTKALVHLMGTPNPCGMITDASEVLLKCNRITTIRKKHRRSRPDGVLPIVVLFQIRPHLD